MNLHQGPKWSVRCHGVVIVLVRAVVRGGVVHSYHLRTSRFFISDADVLSPVI